MVNMAVHVPATQAGLNLLYDFATYVPSLNKHASTSLFIAEVVKRDLRGYIGWKACWK